MLKLLIILLSLHSFISQASIARDLKTNKPKGFKKFQITRKQDSPVEKRDVVQPQQSFDVDEIYACKLLPSDVKLPESIHDPTEATKELLKKIIGSRQKFLFLYALSVDLVDYKAFAFMKYCSKNDVSLSTLVREEAVALIYDDKMKDEMEVVMEDVAIEMRDCTEFKPVYQLLKKKLNDWESPDLSDQIFSMVKELLASIDIAVKPNIELPKLLRLIIRKQFEHTGYNLALQLLATLMYALDNPRATQNDLIRMWVKARKCSTKKEAEAMGERAEIALKHLPYFRKLFNNTVSDALSVKNSIYAARELLEESYYRYFLDLLSLLLFKNGTTACSN